MTRDEAIDMLFDDYELDKNSVVKDYLKTANDGKNCESIKKVNHANKKTAD